MAPFYLFKKTRPSPTLNRDAPSVIKARIQTVSLTVVVSVLSTFYILYVTAEYSFATSLHFLGVYPLDPLSIGKSLLLTFILYLAPLYEHVYLEDELSPLSTVLDRMKLTLGSSQGYRNYVAGPVTEELVWRSTLIPLHLLAGVSATRITFLTPLYFGIAHIHHFYEFCLTHPGTPVVQGLLRSVFQLSYTTIFGWYASFIFLRTGNVYAACIIHTFCNYMGLPRLFGRVKLKRQSKSTSFSARGKEDSNLVRQDEHAQQPPLHYTIIYYALLLTGIYGFSRCLFLLTEGSPALTSFE